MKTTIVFAVCLIGLAGSATQAATVTGVQGLHPNPQASAQRLAAAVARAKARAAPINGQGTDVELQLAVEALADARGVCDGLRPRLLAPVHETVEYKQALAVLNEAQGALASAKESVPYPQEKVAALAATVLGDENTITRIEQPALDASAEWKVASAKIQAASNALEAVQQARARLQREAADRSGQQREAAIDAANAARVQRQQQLNAMRLQPDPEPLTPEQQAQQDKDAEQAQRAQYEQDQEDRRKQSEEYDRQQKANDDYIRQQQEENAREQKYIDDMNAANEAAEKQRQADEEQARETEQRMRDLNGG